MSKIKYQSTKIIELGSCCFRQPKAKSHCQYLHGYRLYAKFWFTADNLDENNWVVDFGGLKQLKKKLEFWFDHTTVISKEDPCVGEFVKLESLGVCSLRILEGGVGIERFARLCFTIASGFVKENTNDRCWVSKVEVFEHEKNSSIYKEKRNVKS